MRGPVFGFFRVIFSLNFPLLVLTLCGVSYVLTTVMHAPEFALWRLLAMYAYDQAGDGIWVVVGTVIFAVVAVLLAWVSFREQQLKLSSVIVAYFEAAAFVAFTFWLRTVWPYEHSLWQLCAYALIMLITWSIVVEALMLTLGIVVHARRSRPARVKPPRQEPHGGGPQTATSTTRRPDKEPETI